MKSDHPPLQRGFSLLEVMVSLAIISVGLLGVAKLQGLALTNTGVASMRSLAAIEAASLAATMHENRAYWTSPGPATSVGGIVVQSTGPTAAPTVTATGLPSPAPDCTSASLKAPPYCGSNTDLAAYDLQQWATAVQAVLPQYVATITCTGVSPVSCTIQMTWQERVGALNKQETAAQQAAAAANAQYLQAPTYTLYVEP